MKWKGSYDVLKNQRVDSGKYSIVPIRYEDRNLIMKWRNEQIYHLRQDKSLNEENQDQYFQEVVSKLFEIEKPNQILFSYLEDEVCIGYGGLVHINWIDMNSEVSFIMNTEFEKDNFQEHWKTYLSLIEQAAFVDLHLHKLYIYAFDLRPHLYTSVESAGYFEDARLKDHCKFDGKYIEVVIHSKINFQS